MTWSVPETNGGVVFGYNLYRNDGNGTDVSTTPDATCGMTNKPAPQQCTLTNLKAGDEYQIQMTTINEAGEGPRSDPKIYIAAKVPGAPADLQITETKHYPFPTMTVTWKSGTDEGAQIFDYVLGIKLAGEADNPHLISMGGTELAAWPQVSFPIRTLATGDFSASAIPWEVGRHYQIKVILFGVIIMRK